MLFCSRSSLPAYIKTYGLAGVEDVKRECVLKLAGREK